jgi:hypothetical protein
VNRTGKILLGRAQTKKNNFFQVLRGTTGKPFRRDWSGGSPGGETKRAWRNS